MTKRLYLTLCGALLAGCPNNTVYDCTEVKPENQAAFDKLVQHCISDSSAHCTDRVQQSYCKPSRPITVVETDGTDG